MSEWDRWIPYSDVFVTMKNFVEDSRGISSWVPACLCLESERAENEDEEEQSDRVTSSNWVILKLKTKLRRYAGAISDLKPDHRRHHRRHYRQHLHLEIEFV